jgi:hypothetical protein
VKSIRQLFNNTAFGILIMIIWMVGVVWAANTAINARGGAGVFADADSVPVYDASASAGATVTGTHIWTWIKAKADALYVAIGGDAGTPSAIVLTNGTGLPGTSASFSDPDSNYTATDLDAALAELFDVINGGVPNAATGKVDWSQLVNVPAGFADGIDADTGGATAWDDIGNPDANDEIDMGAYIIELNVADLRIGDGGSNYFRVYDDSGTIKVSFNGNAVMNSSTITMTDEAISHQTGTSDGDYFSLAAYDLDGTAYQSLVRLVASNTPHLELGPATNFVKISQAGLMTFEGTSDIDLPADSVDNADIGDDQIDSEHYVAGSIDNEHLADDAVDSDELASGSVDADHLSVGATLPTVISGDPDSLDDTLSTNPKLYDGGFVRYNAAGEATLDAFTTAGQNVSILFYPSVAIIVNPNAAQTITRNGVALSQGEALINDSNYGLCVLTYLGTNSIDAQCSADIVQEVE